MKDNYGKTTDRFLKYIQIGTTSAEDAEEVPSTPEQLQFAQMLAQEMREMGLENVRLMEHGYVFGEIPSNLPGTLEHEKAAPGRQNTESGRKEALTIGFIAHMDTAPEAPGDPVKPRVVWNYPGGEIALNDCVKLDPAVSPSLQRYIGQDLIVTDGNTLLGSDDKAGIAEILTMAERLLQDPQIPHGKIVVGFTPDEEVGRGAEFFDVQAFGADLAYTVDGGTIGEIEFENFNAAEAEVTVSGFRVHPGSAKNILKNAVTIGMEFDRMLPAHERPEYTEGYEGYYYLMDFTGNTDEAKLQYILRDFDADSLEKRKETMRKAADLLNCRWPGAVQLEIRDNYRNMREKIGPHMHLIHTAEEAFSSCGVTPAIIPCRGGTDGAQLSYRGLPCPNLGTGGYAFHGPFEHITAEGMDIATAVLCSIVKEYSKNNIRTKNASEH